MAIYAIGDVQGCYDELTALLGALTFDPLRDRVFFTGDLVNRGPKSVDVLRLVKSLGDAAVTVLGNHDLHLLAVARGHGADKPGDTFHDVLAASDRDELMEWLRHRPLLHREPVLDVTLIHAGLPPQWDLDTAAGCAAEVEAVLGSDAIDTYFDNMYGNRPDLWSMALVSWDRLRFITNCFTRLRYCDADGRVALKSKDAPGSQPPGYLPWFQVPDRRSAGHTIICGHWSTLGAGRFDDVYALDSGCVWGGKLTGIRLDSEREFVSVPCTISSRPQGDY
jgi:bis(5'-nucleosyl)-tetraphosphatase (symmetrical)